MHLPAVLAFLLLIMPAPAWALAGQAQALDHSSLRFLTSVDATGKTAELSGGLELTPENGWHSYWRMPGEGGLAPTFDWSSSKNVKSVAVLWPMPKRFETMGLYSFGYDEQVIFPLDIVLSEAGKPATLTLKAEIMVCHDICIPEHFNVSLDIPAGDAKKAAEANAIDKARKNVPQTDSKSLRIDSAVLGPKALVIRAWSQKGYEHADLLAEVKDGSLYITAPPVITPDPKDKRAATLSLPAPEGIDDLAKKLMQHSVTFTLIQGNQAAEKTVDF